MAVERAKLSGGDGNAEDPTEAKPAKKLIDIDSFGIAPFAIASILGLLLGSIKFGAFSLTTTGGYLLVSLVFGHFGKMGKINLMPPAATLRVFREFGLMLFLIGAGIAGGAKFVECFQPIYFLYGALMTITPMVIGFLFAKYVLKLSLLNSLGSLTGGMTSTPALGTLINVSGTEDVASAYAATYPIALIAVVLASQFLVMIFM
jgi:putative transport protein